MTPAEPAPPSPAARRKRSRWFVLLFILLVPLCVLGFPYVMFVGILLDTRTVAESASPERNVTLYVESRSFFGTCYNVSVQGPWSLFARDVPVRIMCGDGYTYLPFDGDRLRFEWFADRGLVALAADGVGTVNGKPVAQYLRLMRYDESGNVADIGVKELRNDPSDRPPDPVPRGEGVSVAEEYYWYDQRIRAMLGDSLPAGSAPD